MGRYLKSISMKAFDGSAIKIPFCCINCKKDQCKLPCQEYAEEMKDQRCSRFEMEFGIYDDWRDSLWQIILVIGLVIAGCNLSMNMKDVSLCDLESRSKRIEERFARITNSLCQVEVGTSNICSSMDALSAELSAASNRVVSLKSELRGLQSEIALCSNAVHHVWWWWK